MMIISVIINWQPCRWFIWNFQKFSLIQTPASHGWKIFSKLAEDDDDDKDDDGDEDDEMTMMFLLISLNWKQFSF